MAKRNLNGRKGVAVSTKEDFPIIFEKLKAILKKYEKDSVIEKNTEADYYLNTKKLDQKKRPVFFAAVSINKISVSFYLMPVYCFPELLDGITTDLRKHLHGKSCFRFKQVEPTLFKELAALTKQSIEQCKKDQNDR